MEKLKAHDLDSKLRTRDILLDKDVEFMSMYLPEIILKGLSECGFKKPSPIQLKALPLARCGYDLIVQAKSGTGKTLVFSLTALELVRTSSPCAQALILAPTREIAYQISDVIASVGHPIKGLKIATFIGGLPLADDQIKALDCHIAVGTPGRINHLVELGFLDLRAIKLFVMDEADELLKEEMLKDIRVIMNSLPIHKQILASSATYPPELMALLKEHMHNACHITPDAMNNGVLLGLRQFVSLVPYHPDHLARIFNKQKQLLNLLSTIQFDQCIVFSNYHSRAESIRNMLCKKGWAAEWLAGKQDQVTRMESLSYLKSHQIRILVTTDVAARGIDAHSVNLIINMDVPWDSRTYLHRMGRAGRYGSHGIAITILNEGTEVELFQKTLGKIGGTAIHVSILPLENKHLDIWTTNDSQFEQMYGVLPNEDSEVSEKECESLDDLKVDEGSECEADQMRGKKQVDNSRTKRKRKKDREKKSETVKEKMVTEESKSVVKKKVKFSGDNTRYPSKETSSYVKKEASNGYYDNNDALDSLTSHFSKMSTNNINYNHSYHPGKMQHKTQKAKQNNAEQNRPYISTTMSDSNDFTTSSSSSCSEGEYILSEPESSDRQDTSLNSTCGLVTFDESALNNWYRQWYIQSIELQNYLKSYDNFHK